MKVIIGFEVTDPRPGRPDTHIGPFTSMKKAIEWLTENSFTEVAENHWRSPTEVSSRNLVEIKKNKIVKGDNFVDNYRYGLTATMYPLQTTNELNFIPSVK